MNRIVALLFAIAGVMAAGIAVIHERRMQRHRQPGVSYRDVTFRRDGGWRRDDLFTPEGLAHQRRASRAGLVAAACWLLGLASLLFLVPLVTAVTAGPARTTGTATLKRAPSAPGHHAVMIVGYLSGRS